MNVALFTKKRENLAICITLLFGTETRGQHCQQEGSLIVYGIERVDNDADELKINFWACCNNVNWTAQKYFIRVQTCRLRLPVVQGDTEGSFIPYHEHVGNHLFPTQKNV